MNRTMIHQQVLRNRPFALCGYRDFGIQWHTDGEWTRRVKTPY
jgi:hypothetical protein